MGTRESAQSFTRAIKSTKEFKDLVRAKQVIEKNTTLKKQVIDYNNKISNVYQSNNNPSNIKSQIDRLSKYYSGLTQKEEVKNFLNAMDAFDEMMFRTNQYINDLVQKDIMLK